MPKYLKQVLSGGEGTVASGRGEEVGKGHRRMNMVQILIYLYVSRKCTY
jgi:hypothetical protein